MTDIRIPEDMWDDDSQGSISVWFYATGEMVEAGAIIAEVMNEKMSFELLAPSAGGLTIVEQAEQPVSKGQLVATIAP